MLSFASAAYRADKTLLSTFAAISKPCPTPAAIPKRWLVQTQPDAWTAARRDPQDPTTAMRAYVAWLKKLPGTPVFVAYPPASISCSCTGI